MKFTTSLMLFSLLAPISTIAVYIAVEDIQSNENFEDCSLAIINSKVRSHIITLINKSRLIRYRQLGEMPRTRRHLLDLVYSGRWNMWLLLLLEHGGHHGVVLPVCQLVLREVRSQFPDQTFIIQRSMPMIPLLQR